MRAIICISFIFFGCQQKNIVVGEVSQVITNPVRGGHVLKYLISYELDGKTDSTILIGNRIYKKGTDQRFYFQKGDSVVLRLSNISGLYQFNSFIKIHSLVERVRKDAKSITVVPISSERVLSVYHVDYPPLLPNAGNYEDNRKIISDHFKELSLIIEEPLVFYIKIDTLGKAYIHQIYSEDSLVLKMINEGVNQLPLFSPAKKIKKRLVLLVILKLLIKNE